MKTNSKFVANLFKSCGLLMPFVVVSCGEQKPEETPIPQNDKNEQKKVEKEQTEADDAQEEAKKLAEELNKENEAKQKEDLQKEAKAVAKKTDNQSKDKGAKQVEGEEKAEIASKTSSDSGDSSSTPTVKPADKTNDQQ